MARSCLAACFLQSLWDDTTKGKARAYHSNKRVCRRRPQVLNPCLERRETSRLATHAPKHVKHDTRAIRKASGLIGNGLPLMPAYLRPGGEMLFEMALSPLSLIFLFEPIADDLAVPRAVVTLKMPAMYNFDRKVIDPLHGPAVIIQI